MTEKEQVPATLEQLEKAWEVRERPFTSATPVIGPLLVWLRTAWNNVSTKWYVRGVIEQQNAFNRLVVAQFREVERGFEAVGRRLGAVDGRVVAQDREQSEIIHDMGEVAAQLVQLRRQLEALEERVGRMEGRGTEDGEGIVNC